jgi:hypothetical protein
VGTPEPQAAKINTPNESIMTTLSLISSFVLLLLLLGGLVEWLRPDPLAAVRPPLDLSQVEVGSSVRAAGTSPGRSRASPLLLLVSSVVALHNGLIYALWCRPQAAPEVFRAVHSVRDLVLRPGLSFLVLSCGIGFFVSQNERQRPLLLVVTLVAAAAAGPYFLSWPRALVVAP